MRGILVTAIVLYFIPKIIMQPHIGVYVWSWLGYMNPHRLTWGFAYTFPFAQLVAIATFIGVLFCKERNKIPWSAITILLILLNVWFFITTLFAIYPDAAWEQWKKVFKIQLMVFITLYLIRGRERINTLVWVITLSLAFFGIKGGIFTIMTGGQYMVVGPPGSFITGNTEIALALIMTLPLMRYLQLNTENKWIRHALTAGMILTAFSIVGSYSRGAFLAGAAMAVFLWMKSRQKFWLALGLVILLPIMLKMMPEQWFERMGTIKTYEEDESAMGRINAWWFAFNLANDRPLTGGGFETFARDLFLLYAPDPESLQDAHSIYFEILGEHGYIGLILFLAIGFLTWRTASRVIKKCADHDELKWARDLVSMIQVSLVGYAVGGAFLGMAYFDLYYHLIALVVLTNIAVDEKLARINYKVPKTDPIPRTAR